MGKEDFELYQTQVGTNVQFTAFMTAVGVFFVGILISQFDNFDLSIKISISFLIISVSGFLYSTLIFANASEAVSNKSLSNFKKHMMMGDVLSEYLGVYLLIISIPLVINVITSDLYLRVVTLVSSLGGFAIYQFSGLSILSRHFRQKSSAISFFFILAGLILFFSQIYSFYFTYIAIIFLILILIITFFAIKKSR